MRHPQCINAPAATSLVAGHDAVTDCYRLALSAVERERWLPGCAREAVA